MLKGLWAAMRVAMEPRAIGAAVVAAIRANDFYILPHGEFLPEVIARHRAIEAAFAADDDTIPDARRAFEQQRRAKVDALSGMAAKG